MIDIKIGSRKSKLAMWQTETVAATLQQYGIKTSISSMDTKGDKMLNTTIAKIGSKGVFTEELEQQLANGETDIAVHSAKDMQSSLPSGFSLIAFTKREKVNDVLVSTDSGVDIEDTSRKLRIGTSSVRRIALLKHYYPHLETVEVRGNLQTRIEKMKRGTCDALMLAFAGVKRMGYDDMIIKIFPKSEFIPPVGQGCIAVEASDNLDQGKREMIRDCLNNRESELCLIAERAFLKTLEGGCSIPAFALATLVGSQITLTGGLASLDGNRILQKRLIAPDSSAEKLGQELGNFILDHGGRQMLAEIKDAQAQ
jgi:hydroxymethylbilane synthase